MNNGIYDDGNMTALFMIFYAKITTFVLVHAEKVSEKQMKERGYGLSSVHAEENEQVKMASTNLMVNDYIGLFVNNTGKFSIGTTGGNLENKRDDNQRLLYGYATSSTSYTTFCVDGTPYIYDGSGAVFNTDTASHTSAQQKDGIDIVQTLSFCRNGATGRDDVVEIKYMVTNMTEEGRSIAGRAMSQETYIPVKIKFIRTLKQMQGGNYTKEHMHEILSVQRENGSIYDDVEDTMLFIVLTDETIKGGE